MNEEMKIQIIKETLEIGQLALENLKQAMIKLDSVKS